MTTVLQSGKTKNRHLIFGIADDLYGLEVHYLKEVFQSGDILKLPRTSSVLEGIVNLRGYIVSIFNLSVLLWGTESSKEEETTSKIESNSNIILLVTVKNQDIGILVDQIHQLDTITEFKGKDDSYFHERELLNPSLVSKIGLLDDKQAVFILDLEGLLEDFVTSRKSEKKKITSRDEDFNFDFDQYTLPDPDESPEKAPTEAIANFDIDQLKFPENLKTDEFDQTVLDKVDIEKKGGKGKKKPKSKKGETKSNPEDTSRTKKTKIPNEVKNDVRTEENSKETDDSKRKDEIEEIKKKKKTSKVEKGSKNEIE